MSTASIPQRILIIYFSKYGQTQKIADYIHTRLKHSFHSTLLTLSECQEALNHDPHFLGQFCAIMIGSPVYYGHHSHPIVQFIHTHHTLLATQKSFFFSVNLTARKPEKCQADNNPYVRKLFNKIQWKPDLIGVFAGSLQYPKYGFFDKIMIKLIMKITKGISDTQQSIDYTNWQQVDQFISEVSNSLQHP